MFNYNPLWETMKTKNITQYKLIKEYNFSTGTLDALRKNSSCFVLFSFAVVSTSSSYSLFQKMPFLK